MRKIKVLLMYIIIILFSMILISSCTKKQEKPAPESKDEPKPVPEVVDEIESEIIDIMSQADLIPYYKKQIELKMKKEKEKKDLVIKLGMVSQDSSSQDQKESGGEGKQQKEMGVVDSLIKFEPSPITINDILLSEILKAEADKKSEEAAKEIPNDIAFIWDEINKKITGLHKKWNMLESEVIKSGASQEAINGFKTTLNNLTISAAEYNYLNTLFHSNKLTSYIPELISNFKKKVPSPIYFIRYHLKQIILDYSVSNYENAAKNYNKLTLYKDALVSQLVDKKLTDLVNKLNTSVKDLEDSLKLKDLNIIKIKASVLMANIKTIEEEFLKQQ